MVTWDGGGGDLNWNNAANWSTDSLPGEADDVEIPGLAGDVAIYHSSGSTSINSLTSNEALTISGGTFDIADASTITDTLTLGSSSSAILTGSGDITVGGQFNWTGGRLQGTGKLITSGDSLFSSSNKYLERTIDNDGTTQWTGGTIYANEQGVFNNLFGATFDAQSNHSFSGGSATFNNTGTLLKSAGTSTTSISTELNNTGTVHVQSGRLALSNGTSTGGIFQVDVDSSLNFLNGTYVLDSGSSLSGDGTLSLTSFGRLEVNSNISIGGLEVLSTSSSTTSIPHLTGSGDITVGGQFNWTAGKLQGTGKLTAAEIWIQGSRDKYLETTLENTGTATWTDGRIRTSSATMFINGTDATFDAQSDDSFGISAVGVFHNAGTLVKSAGTGYSIFYPTLNNTGTVQAQTGTLYFLGAVYNQTDGETVLDGGAIRSTGTIDVQGGEFAGSGTVTGPLNLGDSSKLRLEINGSTAGGTATDYDQIDLVGTLTIGANVPLLASTSNDFEPTIGQQLVIINNDGSDPIVGSFDGLPEGAVLSNFLGSTLDAQISYLGLDGATGNDVVLTIFKDNRVPSANAGGPYVVDEGATVMLDASATFDLNEPNSGLTFEWDLDYDGTSFDVDLTGETPTISYPDNFSARPIAVRVTDSEGAYDTAATTITVRNVNPTATITGAPSSAVEGATVSLGSSVYDPGTSDTHTYAWTVSKNGAPYVAGGGSSFNFITDENGEYEVVLTITDNDSGTGSSVKTITVNSAAPVVVLDSTVTVERGEAFTLAGTFTDPGSDTWTATVNYADGLGDQVLELDGQTFELSHTSAGVYSAVVTIDDGEGGVGAKTVTMVVERPDLPDLKLISSDVLFDPINPDVGESLDFLINVNNVGEISSASVPVSVQVYDADTEAFVEIGRPEIGSLAPDSEAEIRLTWDGLDSQPALPSEDSYFLVRVVVDPDATIEDEDVSNNEAIQVLQVGSPDFGSAGLVATVNPFTTTQGAYLPVGGTAFYDFSTIPGTDDYPVQNASVIARLIDSSTGEVLRVSSAQTGSSGRFNHYIRAPEVDGVYTLQYEINEGTLSGVFESTLTVYGEPVDPPPRPRGSPGGSGYVFSASVVPPASLELGVETTILGSFDYELDDELDVEVTFNNLFPVAGQLQTFEIGSTAVNFPTGGITEPIVEPMQWKPTAEGYHILQVVAEPSVSLKGHFSSTQLVLVGDLDTTSLNVQYDATVTGSSGSSGEGERGEGEEGATGGQAPSPGDTLLFTLTYENTGSTTITGGFLMDDFDENLLSTPFDISDGGVVDGNAIRWELGDLAPGETGFVTYRVTIKSGAEFPPGSAYLLNTAILNANQSVAATTSELIVSNKAPVISGLDVDSITSQDRTVTLTGTFSDASANDTHTTEIQWGDGTFDTLTFSNGERSFSIDHTYSLTPPVLGDRYEVLVSLTDASSQNTIGQVFALVESSIQVTVTTENIFVSEGDTATNSGAFFDAVTNVTTLTASSGTISKTGDQSGTWDWQAGTEITGDDAVQTVTITATDGVATKSVEFTLTVANVPVSFSAGADESLASSDLGQFSRSSIAFEDPGADQWTGTVDFGDGSGEQALAIDQTNKTFDLNHEYTDEGTFTVTVRIQDDDSEFVSDSFQVSVVLNAPPIARNDLLMISEDSASVNITGVPGDSGSGLLSNDSSPRGDELTITAIDTSTISKGSLQLIDGLVFYNPQGEYEHLSAGEIETQSFLYTIADTNGETSSATATIEISGSNDAPTLGIEDPSVAVFEGETASNQFSFSDSDANDDLAVNASIGNVVDNGDGNWVWTWATQDGPTETTIVDITVFDGQLTTSESFELIVVNQPPEFLSVATDASLESPSSDQTIELSGQFQDDGLLDTHVVVVDWGDGTQPEEISVNQDLDLFSASHTYSNGGYFVVDVTITDNDGAAMSTSTTAAVQGVSLVDGKLWVIGGDNRDQVEVEYRWRYDGSGWWWDPSNWFEAIEVDAKLGEQNVEHEFLKSEVQSIEIVTLGDDDNVEIKYFVDLPATIRLGEGDDRVDVDSGSATIFAGPGNDRVKTGIGDDFVDGGSGDDVISTLAGNNTVIDLQGNNRISTGFGEDSVSTGDGDDRIDTGYGDDTIASSGGNNRVDAGSGNDSVTLGSGNDDVDLGSGNDLAWLGAGDDRADGGSGDDTLFGEAGNDRLEGGRGNDVIVAGDGDDRIDGDSGLDVLIGGMGADLIAGGRDDDLLIAGWTAYDDNQQALQDILAEWTSEHEYSQRVTNLRQGTGSHLGGTYLITDETVFDDSSEDTLDGNAGRDWFFASLTDELKRKRSNELLD